MEWVKFKERENLIQYKEELPKNKIAHYLNTTPYGVVGSSSPERFKDWQRPSVGQRESLFGVESWTKWQLIQECQSHSSTLSDVSHSTTKKAAGKELGMCAWVNPNKCLSLLNQGK